MNRTLYPYFWMMWDYRRTRAYRAEARAVLRRERLDRAAMDRFQWEQLTRLLRHAYETTVYYRRRFDDAGVHPDSIRSSEDLHRLPILTRQDVQVHVEDMVSSKFDKARLDRNATSGSTGNPMPFYRSAEEAAVQLAVKARTQAWAGFQQGDKLAILWGADTDIPAMDWFSRFRMHFLKREAWLNSYNMTPEKMEAFARLLIRWQPRHIQAYAASIYCFAQFLRERGLDRIRPFSITTSAEKLWDYQRALVEDVFQCRVFDFYGAREASCMAAECEMHRGLHVLSDNVHVELLNEGRPAAPGEIGEIIVTPLKRMAMPLIRFRNGDMARASGETCPCGRPFPLVQEIVGRANDIIVTPGGQYIHGAFFNHLFFGVPGVRQFQIHQKDAASMDVLLVGEGTLGEETFGLVRQKIGQQVGAGMEIRIRQVPAIAPTKSGKHRYIISEVGPTFARTA